MKHLRQYIRGILLEDWGSDHGVNDFGCGRHSAGFIDDTGQFHGLGAPDGETHDDFLLQRDMDEIPIDWIVVHNAQQLTVRLDYITLEQIDTLIDLWLYCKKYQKWIYDPFDPNHSLKLFPHHGGGYEELTVDDFLEMYGSIQQTSKFFNALEKGL